MNTEAINSFWLKEFNIVLRILKEFVLIETFPSPKKSKSKRRTLRRKI